jgi:hypothetical protein
MFPASLACQFPTGAFIIIGYILARPAASERTMTARIDKNNTLRDDLWLKQESQELYHVIQAIDGDREALHWLERRSNGLSLFVQAIRGDAQAFRAFDADEGLRLEDLFKTIGNGALSTWLRQKRLDLFLLFEAIKGDEEAMLILKKKRRKPSYADLAQVIRDLYEKHLLDEEDAEPLVDQSAADAACLVGELHLSKGDFRHAIEAFSRALEVHPTADAHEGRARAYRSLAAFDERQAEELRRRS